MRYRDLVILIALVAVSSWAYEANIPEEETPPPPVSKSYFSDDEEDPQEYAPSARLSVAGDSRFLITLSYPKDEEWEPIGLNQLLIGDRIFEIESLSQVDDFSWEFGPKQLSQEARAALESSTSLKVRLNVLDSHMKMSRAMRSFQVETPTIQWAAR
ncbi:MAG: hypothetical protein KC800_06050 [Candidatus Eremiobacteraeota bacterium]|nr:hypothetical protein [Candidatus Eremiobacteraeota bacterium]